MSIGDSPDLLSQRILVIRDDNLSREIGRMLIWPGKLLDMVIGRWQDASGAAPSRHAVRLCQEGTGSVRFVSVPDFSTNHRFRSFRGGNFFSRFDAVRPAFFGCVVDRSGSVRLGSGCGSGRFQN